MSSPHCEEQILILKATSPFDFSPSHPAIQLGNVLETPLFLLFSDPSRTSGSGSTLPIQIYESTLGADNVTGVSSSSSSEGHLGDGRPGLVQLEYKVETGEAERIAVDGAAKSGDSMGESGSTRES